MKILRNSLIAAGALVGAVYGINAGVIAVTASSSVQAGEEAVVLREDSNLKIVGYDNLQSGGVGFIGWSIEASGYVNMLEEENTIYVDTDKWNANGSNDYLYRHEYTHILQKKMIAEEAGGFPSIWDPIQSAKYYYNFIRLNNELAEVMPEVDYSEGILPITNGLEAAAECYAQPYSSVNEEPVYYNAPYLVDGYCDAEQKRLAVSLFTTDEWFGELTDEELAALKEVNITTTKSVAKRWVK